MDSGVVIATAVPFGASRMIPQCIVQVPAFATVAGQEQSARQGPRPEPAGLIRAAGDERPDQRHTRAIHRIRHGRKGGCRQFPPRSALIVGTVHLYAEMAQIQGGVEAAVAAVPQHCGYRITDKGHSSGDPFPAFQPIFQQPLAGRHVEPLRHLILPTVPETRKPRRHRRPGRSVDPGRRSAAH